MFTCLYVLLHYSYPYLPLFSPLFTKPPTWKSLRCPPRHPAAIKVTSYWYPPGILSKKTLRPSPTALAHVIILSSSSADPQYPLDVEADQQHRQQWTFTGRPPYCLLTGFQPMPFLPTLTVWPARRPSAWGIALPNFAGNSTWKMMGWVVRGYIMS